MEEEFKNCSSDSVLLYCTSEDEVLIKNNGIKLKHRKHIIYNKKYYKNILKKFRKVCSNLNKELNVCEIKMTSNSINEINFSKNITCNCFFKNFNSLLNITNNFQNKQLTHNHFNSYNKLQNKLQCKYNLINFINNFNVNSKFKDKLSLWQYIKLGIQILDFQTYVKELYDSNGITFNYFNEINQNIKLKEKLLNVQWNNYIKNINSLEGLIPIVDISLSMGYTYFSNNTTQRNFFFKKKSILNALGLGIIVCEKSVFNKRLLLFSKKCLWVSFDSCTQLTDYIERLIHYFDNYYENEVDNTNFVLMENSNIGDPINLLLDSFSFNNLSTEQVEKIKFIIFSDMQFNDINIDNVNNLTIYGKLQELFNICGINNNNINCPYNICNFIFWNLRTTNGFPVLTSTNKTLMLSGNNPNLLNIFTKNYKNLIKDPNEELMKMFSNKYYNLNNKNFTDIIENTI